MPFRNQPLVTNEVYHVYNRSIAQIEIFTSKREYLRFIETMDFYRFCKNSIKFSSFLTLKTDFQNKYLMSLYRTSKQVDIISFSIMPNHYHLLVRQLSDNGIANFVRKFQDSYAKYFNSKYKRFGGLFVSPFKAVRVWNEEQLVHTSRYIHLNPVSSYIIKDFFDLRRYPWTSYFDFITNSPRPLVNTDILLSYFKNLERIVEFTEDQVDYQRSLERIKHLVLD